jgi:ArsR family transcriptional regulator
MNLKSDIKRIEKVSKALGDPYRIQMMEAIMKQKGWMQCSVLVEMFDLAQSTVSHHLKQLVEADLLILEKDGRCARYMINKEGMGEFVKYLSRYEE